MSFTDSDFPDAATADVPDLTADAGGEAGGDLGYEPDYAEGAEGADEGQDQDRPDLQLVDEPSIEGLQSQLKQFQTDNETYKPAHEFIEEFGGVEGLEPFKPVINSIAMSDADGVRDSLRSIDEDLYAETIWRGALEFKVPVARGLMKDPEVRQAVLNSDPEYQAFIRAKESGALQQAQQPQLKIEKIDLSKLDPDDPMLPFAQSYNTMGDVMNQLQEQNRQQADQLRQSNERNDRIYKEGQERQAKERVVSHAGKLESEFRSSVAKVVKWDKDPEKNKAWNESVYDEAESKFFRDPQSKQAYDRYMKLAAGGKDALLRGAKKALETKFNQVLNKVVSLRNPSIKGAAAHQRSVHTQSTNVRTITPGSGTQPRVEPNKGRFVHDGSPNATVKEGQLLIDQMKRNGTWPFRR